MALLYTYLPARTIVELENPYQDHLINFLQIRTRPSDHQSEAFKACFDFEGNKNKFLQLSSIKTEYI
jgi:hypothetical protein